MSCDVHLSDDGTRFIFPITDCDDQVVPINGASSLTVVFQKPDGTPMVKTGELYTDGLDGIMEYITDVDEIDQLSDWSVQGVVITPAGKFHSDVEVFKVVGNLPIA